MPQARFIDGRLLASLKGQVLKEKISQFAAESGVIPTLHVILIGQHAASKVYVENKQIACHAVGIRSYVHPFPAHSSEEEVLAKIHQLNQDRTAHGILLQLPLPSALNRQRLLCAVDPLKDVDGLHPYNLGRLMMGDPVLVPCTPKGCLELIRSVKPVIEGLYAVIVGRSLLVGKPMAGLLVNANVTVTVAHSYTQNLDTLCRQADILITATGTPLFFKDHFIKQGAVVIDVGINRLLSQQGVSSIVGDVDIHSAQRVAGFITPVPGGVGPMTISCLLENTLQAAQQQLLSSASSK